MTRLKSHSIGCLELFWSACMERDQHPSSRTRLLQLLLVLKATSTTIY
ncbi:unnamed protein product, partial [Linum tenue]